MQLAGSVVAPEIALEHFRANVPSGCQLDFGVAAQGQPVLHTIAVVNRGTAPLTLAPLASGGLPAGFSLVADLPETTLPPGQAISLTVRLDAIAAGNFGGVLALYSDDADENPFELALTGDVVAPEITLLLDEVEIATGGAIDFGAIQVGSSSSRTITVRNDGDAPLTLSPIDPAVAAGRLHARFEPRRAGAGPWRHDYVHVANEQRHARNVWQPVAPGQQRRR